MTAKSACGHREINITIILKASHRSFATDAGARTEKQTKYSEIIVTLPDKLAEICPSPEMNEQVNRRGAAEEEKWPAAGGGGCSKGDWAKGFICGLLVIHFIQE